MSMKDDPTARAESGTPIPASKQQAPRRTPEEAATKPPIAWMVLPLILIGLAIYLAR
jgi:hypothetical protein